MLQASHYFLDRKLSVILSAHGLVISFLLKKYEKNEILK